MNNIARKTIYNEKTYTNKKEGIRLENYFDQIEFKLLFFLKKYKRYHIIR
jgi:hypothetical protein